VADNNAHWQLLTQPQETLKTLHFTNSKNHWRSVSNKGGGVPRASGPLRNEIRTDKMRIAKEHDRSRTYAKIRKSIKDIENAILKQDKIDPE